MLICRREWWARLTRKTPVARRSSTNPSTIVRCLERILPWTWVCLMAVPRADLRQTVRRVDANSVAWWALRLPDMYYFCYFLSGLWTYSDFQVDLLRFLFLVELVSLPPHLSSKWLGVSCLRHQRDSFCRLHVWSGECPRAANSAVRLYPLLIMNLVSMWKKHPSAPDCSCSSL